MSGISQGVVQSFAIMYTKDPGEDVMSVDAHQQQLPIVDATGSHLEIGRAIGESLREGFQDVAAGYRESVKNSIGWHKAMTIAKALMPFADEYLPNCMDELRGMAEGSNLQLPELFSMNALQETMFLAGREGSNWAKQEEYNEGCTSLAVSGEMSANGHVLLGHNEDAGSIRSAFPYVVRAKPDDGPAFVGFAYSALLLYQGMNECGIGSVGNALFVDDIRMGTPKLLAYRDVLAANYLEDAIRRTQKRHRGNGNNHLLANEFGEIYDLEVSGSDAALFAPLESYFVHANHILHPRLQKRQWGEHVLNSTMRQKRVERRLSRMEGQLTVDRVFEILSDHSNYPRSVCKHYDEVSNRAGETVGSVVVDLTAGEIHVRAGHPCESETETVKLSV
jgi:isopenicillin-N N-acyltransferase like protein